MEWKIVVIFAINYVWKTYGLELHEQDTYLEQDHHVLLGSATPVFIARLEHQNGSQAKIVYDRAYYPKQGEKIRYYKNSKTVLNGKPGGYYSYSSIGVIDDQNITHSLRQGKSLDESSTMYPEIFVVIDYKTYVAYNKDVTALATYMAAFWNGVDLRFRQMKNPQIRLNIAGLVIATDPDVEPYLKQNSNTSARHTLDSVSKYFHQRFLGYYDVLVSILHWSRKPDEEKTEGYSFFQGVCRNHYSAVLIQDAGGFEGIITAARRLGRLFGSPHDGDQSGKIFGGPCTVMDGYMMSELWGTKNKMQWSKCSIQAMQNHLSTANCLKNKPDVVIPYFKKLPGKLISRDGQCDKMFSGFKSIDEDKCDFLNCGSSCLIGKILCSEEANYLTPPAEGSSCGEGLFCLDGKCVEDPGIHD